MPAMTNPYLGKDPHKTRLWEMGRQHAKTGIDRMDLSAQHPMSSAAYYDGYDSVAKQTEPKPSIKTMLKDPEFRKLLTKDPEFKKNLDDLGRTLTSLACSMYGRRYIRLTLIEQGVDPALAKRYSKAIAWVAYVVAVNASIAWKNGQRIATKGESADA